MTNTNNSSFFKCFSFVYFSISSISKLFNGLLGVPRELFYILLILLYLIFLVTILKEIKVIDVLYYVVIIPPIVFGLIKYNQYIIPIHMFSTVIMFLPAYLIFKYLPIEYIVPGMIYSAYLNIGVALVDFSTTNSLDEYNMSFGYELAASACILFYDLIKHKRYFNILFILLSTYYAFIGGSRGALIFESLTILYFYCFGKKLNRKSFASYFIVAICIAVIVVKFESVIAGLESFMPSNRNIRRIEQNTFFESSTRDMLYDDCKRVINTPERELGAFASRKHITHDPYPHSLLYELQIDFGKYMGFLICAFIVIAGAVSLFVTRETEYSLPAGVYCLTGIGLLCVSSTLYIGVSLPATIALFSLSFSKTKRNRQNEDIKSISNNIQTSPPLPLVQIGTKK